MYMDAFISKLHLQIDGIASAYSARGCGHERDGATLRAAAGKPGPDDEVCGRPTHVPYLRTRQVKNKFAYFMKSGQTSLYIYFNSLNLSVIFFCQNTFLFVC